MIQDKIDKLLPYLRVFTYDDNFMYVRLTVIFPQGWDFSYLKSQSLLLQILANNQNSTQLLLGIRTEIDVNSGNPLIDDKPIDYFFDAIEKVIQINKQKEKKQELLKQKMNELQNLFAQSTLEDVQNVELVRRERSPYEGMVPDSNIISEPESYVNIQPNVIEQYSLGEIPVQQYEEPYEQSQQEEVYEPYKITPQNEQYFPNVDPRDLIYEDEIPLAWDEPPTTVDLDSLPPEDLFIPPIIQNMQNFNNERDLI